MRSSVVYVVCTDEGDFAFNEFYKHIDIDTAESLILVTVQQEALADQQLWDEWFESLTEVQLINKISSLIKNNILNLLQGTRDARH